MKKGQTYAPGISDSRVHSDLLEVPTSSTAVVARLARGSTQHNLDVPYNAVLGSGQPLLRVADFSLMWSFVPASGIVPPRSTSSPDPHHPGLQEIPRIPAPYGVTCPQAAGNRPCRMFERDVASRMSMGSLISLN